MTCGGITNEKLDAFVNWLRMEDRSPGTIEKYRRDVSAFGKWLGQRDITSASVAEWKEQLLDKQYAPVTINSMLIAVKRFMVFCGIDVRVRLLRVQRRLFRRPDRELNRTEYERLLDTAKKQKKERLLLVMETICSTGIRVSEVKYITVEAVQRGRTDIALKGKIRTIILPGKLCRKLLSYAKRKKIASGEIFVTESGRSLSRGQIWAEMKMICRDAGVKEMKVFPHNLRHLFATAFYRTYKDIARLADVLGHSSVETTRIYLTTSGEEHEKQIARLNLIR